MQKLSYLGKIVPVSSIWYRIILSQIITQVYKDSFALTYPLDINVWLKSQIWYPSTWSLILLFYWCWMHLHTYIYTKPTLVLSSKSINITSFVVKTLGVNVTRLSCQGLEFQGLGFPVLRDNARIAIPRFLDFSVDCEFLQNFVLSLCDHFWSRLRIEAVEEVMATLPPLNFYGTLWYLLLCFPFFDTNGFYIALKMKYNQHSTKLLLAVLKMT